MNAPVRMPVVIASVATSADGYIDDASPERLILSTPEDWQEVYRLRDGCDAILVGAETIRRDNPSLKGVPLKVILTRSGEVPGAARIFSSGKVLLLKGDFSADEVVEKLARRGVRKLLVEGGARTLKLFYDAGMIDILRIAVNPDITVGGGVKLDLGPIQTLDFPHLDENPGGMQVKTYYMRGEEQLMQLAIDESRKSVPSPDNYRVGAVVVTSDNRIFTGYTHETSPTHHAEQEAIAKAAAAGADLRQATIVASMEPCSIRRREPESCTSLIIRHGFKRVVFAVHEPSHFVTCHGEELLRQAGIEVTVLDRFASQVCEINAHIR